MDLENIDLEKLTFGKSGKTQKLIYDKCNLNLKTSELYLPFNINKYKKSWSNFEEYSIDCYINNNQQFSDNLDKLDEKINELASNGNEISYTKMYRDNKQYPKLLKLYLPRDNNGNFTTCFFDEFSTPIIVNEQNIESILTKKSIFKTLITNAKVWTYENKVGSTWNIVQLKFSPKTLIQDSLEKTEQANYSLIDE